MLKLQARIEWKPVDNGIIHNTGTKAFALKAFKTENMVIQISYTIHMIIKDKKIRCYTYLKQLN